MTEQIVEQRKKDKLMVVSLDYFAVAMTLGAFSLIFMLKRTRQVVLAKPYNELKS